MPFYNVNTSINAPATSCGINFGPASTVNNFFTINGGGFVQTNAPTYGASSTLQYNTGGAFNIGSEWYSVVTSGQGVPQNVQVDANGTALTFTGGVNRHANGNITLNSGNPSSLTLSVSSGGDISLNGNFSIPNGNATFTSNGRAINFTGTTDQTFSNIPNVTVSYLISNKASGKVNIAGTGNLTINGANTGNSLQMLQTGNAFVFPGVAKNITIQGGIQYATTCFLEGNALTNLTIQDGTGSSPGQVELLFAPGTENLNGLTISRGANGAGGITLGTNLTLAGGLTLTRGTIQFGNTLARTFTVGGSFSPGTGAERALDMSGGNLAHELILNGTNNFGNNLLSFSAGTGGATGSQVTYSGSGAQNVFGNHTYNRLSFAGYGTKTLQTNNITVHSLAISGTANFNVQNFTVTGNAAGLMSIGSGATFTVNGGAVSCAPFPTNFVRSNISLDPASTVRFNYNADANVSTEPQYGNLVVNFSSGSGNKNPRCATGPGGFTTLTVNGNLDFTRTNGTGGNNIFNFTLNGGFNLDLGGNLVSNGLVGTAQLDITFDSQNLNIAGSTNGFGNTTVGRFQGTQTGTVTYDGATAQTLRSMVHNNVTFSGAGVKTLAGGVTSPAVVHFRVNGTGTMSSAIVDLANFNFDIGLSATITGTFSGTNMFRTSGTGYLRRYDDTQPFNYTFPIGTNSNYNPATVNITTATFGGSAGSRYIGVRAVGSQDPDLLTNDANILNAYWSVLATNITGVTNGTLDFSYNQSQVTGSDAGFAGGYNVNGSGSFEADLTSVDDVNNVISFASADITTWNSGNLNGNWLAAALVNIPGAIVPFFTRQDGPWSDPNTWSVVGFGGAAAPTAPTNTGSVVRIGNGNTVTLDVNTVTNIADLQIQATGTFDIGEENFSGSSFSGAGTLRLKAASGTRAFPSFTTNTFLTTSGSVVEYNGNTSYSLPASPTTYQSVIVSGGGTKTLTGNLLVSENLSVNTSGTTLELSTFIFNRSAVGGTCSAASGTTIRTAFTAGGLGQNAFPSNFTTYTLSGSTADFYGTAGQQTINPVNYHNLTLSGNRGGNTIRFSNNPTGCSGTFDVSGLSNYTTTWGGGSGRIDFNGTGAQFVPSFLYQRIEVSGNKGGATVTFDPVGTVSIHDQLIFSATNVNYSFANNTIDFAGKNNGTSFTVSNNPTGFPYNNIVVSGDGLGNTIGTNVNINGNLTINASRFLNLGTGNLTMGTGSTFSVNGSLFDNSVSGTNTLNDCNFTVNSTGLIDLSQSNANLGTTTGSLTFNGGTVGGANVAIGSIGFGTLLFPGNGTIGRGNVTVSGNWTLPSSRTLSFTSTSGTKSFEANVVVNGIWDNSANSGVTFNGDLDVNTGATFTVGTGVQTFGGTSNLGGTIAGSLVIPNISISSGSTLTNSRTAGFTVSTSMGAGTGTFIQAVNAVFDFNGTVAITPAVTANASGNIFNYNGASAPLKATTYHILNVLGGGTSVISGDVTANLTLNLNSNSVIQTGANTVILPAGASLTGFGANAYVFGRLQKNVSAGSPTIVYEIGDASNYLPVNLNFSGVTTGGDLLVSTSSPINPIPGGIALNPTISANRRWNLTSVNTLVFGSYNGIFNFAAGDLVGGATNSDLRGAIHNGTTWAYPSTTNLIGNSGTLNSVSDVGVVVLASCINPILYNVTTTFSGAHCAGSPGSPINLSGSQTGVSYQLQVNGVDEGSPLTGTGSPLAFGNYVPNGAYTVFATIGLTGCSGLMNNTVNVVTHPLPTLTSATQAATVCSGTNATVNLAGLLASSNHTVTYQINGVVQPTMNVNSDAGGNASFSIPVISSQNGQLLEVTSLVNNSLAPNCSQSFVAGNSFLLGVFPRPTVNISANEFVCLNQTAPIDFFFTGTGPWNMTYKINGVLQALVVSPTSPFNTVYGPATASRQYDVVSLSDANCPATPAELDSHFIDVPIPCEIVWNGSQSTSWTDPDNWTPNNSAPSPNTTVIIPGGVNIPNQPNLVANATCATVSTLVGSNLFISPSIQLTMRGDLNGGGGKISGPGKLIFGGTGLQTVTGNALAQNVEFANTSGAGVVVAPGASLSIDHTGLVTFLPNARLTNNGNFQLNSEVGNTARVGQIPSSAIINGEITQQRYLPYLPSASGSWYFMGSPFSGKNFTDWVDNFRVSGLVPGFGSQGSGIIPSTEPERSTIFKYVEATHNQRVDTVQKIGWTIPAAADNINPGQGYRVFVNYYSNSSHKFDNKGTLTRGDFNFPSLTRNEYASCIPVNFPCGGDSWRGWNLLANPYPCDINWDAAAGAWTKPSSMQNAWYRWNALGSGYGVYQSGIYAGVFPAPANPELIPSGQGFFVRLVDPGNYNATLTVRENAKVITPAATFSRQVSFNEMLKMKLVQPSATDGYAYECVIRFSETATDGFDPQLDLFSLGSNRFYFSIDVASQQMVVGSFSPITENKIIPLNSYFQGQVGDYRFDFSNLSSFGSDVYIYLKDNFSGDIFDVRTQPQIGFSVNQMNITMVNRFELVFGIEEVVGVKKISDSGYLLVAPNPSSSGEFDILLDKIDGKTKAEIFDMHGKVVFSTILTQAKSHLKTELPQGVYRLSVSDSKTIRQKAILVK